MGGCRRCRPFPFGSCGIGDFGRVCCCGAGNPHELPSPPLGRLTWQYPTWGSWMEYARSTRHKASTPSSPANMASPGKVRRTSLKMVSAHDPSHPGALWSGKKASKLRCTVRAQKEEAGQAQAGTVQAKHREIGEKKKNDGGGGFVGTFFRAPRVPRACVPPREPTRLCIDA